MSQWVCVCHPGSTDAAGLRGVVGVGVSVLVATVGPGAAAPWCAGLEA